MLVLSRRVDEKIVIPSLNVTLQVVAIRPGVVRLGIDAPREIAIWRAELQERGSESRPEPAWPEPTAVVVHRS